jgi:hypothetical protein
MPLRIVVVVVAICPGGKDAVMLFSHIGRISLFLKGLSISFWSCIGTGEEMAICYVFHVWQDRPRRPIASQFRVLLTQVSHCSHARAVTRALLKQPLPKRNLSLIELLPVSRHAGAQAVGDLDAATALHADGGGLALPRPVRLQGSIARRGGHSFCICQRDSWRTPFENDA